MNIRGKFPFILCTDHLISTEPDLFVKFFIKGVSTSSLVT